MAETGEPYSVARHAVHDEHDDDVELEPDGERAAEEQYAAEEQQRIALRRDDVVQKDAYHESETDADGEGHGESSNFDSRDEEKIRDVKNCAAEKGVENVALIGAANVAEKREWATAHAAERQAPQQARDDNSGDVIPIKKLKGPAGSEFHGVRPRTPTKHAADHEDQGDGVRFRLIHEDSLSLEADEPPDDGQNARSARKLRGEMASALEEKATV
jgi:hypothetical protein